MCRYQLRPALTAAEHGAEVANGSHSAAATGGVSPVMASGRLPPLDYEPDLESSVAARAKVGDWDP
jgi:hypothetical protein